MNYIKYKHLLNKDYYKQKLLKYYEYIKDDN